MCGIAGLIHRGKSSNVGSELQQMLQALKHRGPDSTGYALYAENDGKNFIMRFKVGENVGEGSTSVNEDASVYDERKKLVDQMLKELGANIIKDEKLTPYSYRYEMQFDKDLMEFSKKIESINGVEILSIGKSLELIKDLGDAAAVSERYGLSDVKALDFTLGMLAIIPGTILYCSFGSLALKISNFGDVLSGRSSIDSFIWSLISIFSTILVVILILRSTKKIH